MEFWEEEFIDEGGNSMQILAPPSRCSAWFAKVSQFATPSSLLQHEVMQADIMLACLDNPKVSMYWDEKTAEFEFGMAQ